MTNDPSNPWRLATGAPEDEVTGEVSSTPRVTPVPARETNTGAKFQILLVEDHPMLRERLAELISKSPDMEVCGEADNNDDARRLVQERHPDMVIMDLSLRHSNGMELLKDFKDQRVQVAALVLSMHEDSTYAERALEAGARGYIPKSEASSEVMRAVRKVLAGEVYLNERMTSELIERMAMQHSEPEAAIVGGFSEREFMVFQLVAEGRDVHEMAKILELGEGTIAALRVRIKYKIGAKNRTELYQRAAMWRKKLENA